MVKTFPPELRRVAAQQIACVDSIHRNIAEGNCRRSLKEYLQFLNIGLGSRGESVSGWSALLAAQQISQAVHERVDALACKLGNGLLRLIESLQRKSLTADWEDSFVLRESNASYGSATA